MIENAIRMHGLTITVQGTNLLPATEEPTLHHAEIMVQGEPTSLTVLVRKTGVPTGFALFAIRHGKGASVESLHTFTLPVKWNTGRGGQQIPHTRERGVDNCDYHLIGIDGSFLDIQVSVVTRGGKFFLSAQQIFRGYVVRKRGERVASTEFDFIATESIHAYPGCNYSGIWQGMGAELERIAREVGSSQQYNRVRALEAEWKASFPPRRGDMVAGTVLYFNAVTGTGQIMSDSEERYFVHWTALPAAPMPRIEPGSAVYFREGRRQPGEKLSPAMSIEIAV